MDGTGAPAAGNALLGSRLRRYAEDPVINRPEELVLACESMQHDYRRPPGYVGALLDDEFSGRDDMVGTRADNLAGIICELCVADRLRWLQEQGWRVRYPFGEKRGKNGYALVPAGIGNRVNVYVPSREDTAGPPDTDFDLIAEIGGLPVAFEAKVRNNFNLAAFLERYRLLADIYADAEMECRPAYVVATAENSRARNGLGRGKLWLHGGMTLFMHGLRSGHLHMLASEYHELLSSPESLRRLDERARRLDAA
jgi:hypothetical protein